MRDDGAVLVTSNETGTMQLSLVPPGGGDRVRLTDLPEPVTGQFVPGSGRILLEMDEGGNERGQLYLLDAEPGAALEPLVVEPDFLHVGPRVSRDGPLLAYACNRANGARPRRLRARPGRPARSGRALARRVLLRRPRSRPTGGWLPVLHLTDRTGDNDLILVDLESGESFVVAPEEQDALFGEPAWSSNGVGFHFATNAGARRDRPRALRPGRRAWWYVLEEEWDLDCRADASGRTLVVDANVDGASRVRVLRRRDARAAPPAGAAGERRRRRRSRSRRTAAGSRSG